MEAAFPPLLSGLPRLLLRRPPSLRELVTRIGYAEDYGWFAELVRRLFPEDAEAVLALPDGRRRLERFAQLFQERHFPLYSPFLEWYMDCGDEPPWTWLRRGIPYELYGFGYDALHEMWDGYRDGISALALLGQAPDALYMEPEGIRVSWLESASDHIPPETLLRIPEGGIHPEALTEAVKGTRFEGAAQCVAWVWADTDNLFLDANLEDGTYDGFCDPWDEDVIQQATEEWRRANALLDSVTRLAEWLEEDMAKNFAEMLDIVLERLASPNKEKEEKDNE